MQTPRVDWRVAISNLRIAWLQQPEDNPCVQGDKPWDCGLYHLFSLECVVRGIGLDFDQSLIDVFRSNIILCLMCGIPALEVNVLAMDHVSGYTLSAVSVAGHEDQLRIINKLPGYQAASSATQAPPTPPPQKRQKPSEPTRKSPSRKAKTAANKLFGTPTPPTPPNPSLPPAPSPPVVRKKLSRELEFLKRANLKSRPLSQKMQQIVRIDPEFMSCAQVALATREMLEEKEKIDQEAKLNPYGTISKQSNVKQDRVALFFQKQVKDKLVVDTEMSGVQRKLRYRLRELTKEGNPDALTFSEVRAQLQTKPERAKKDAKADSKVDLRFHELMRCNSEQIVKHINELKKNEGLQSSDDSGDEPSEDDNGKTSFRVLMGAPFREANDFPSLKKVIRQYGLTDRVATLLETAKEACDAFDALPQQSKRHKVLSAKSAKISALSDLRDKAVDLAVGDRNRDEDQANQMTHLRCKYEHVATHQCADKIIWEGKWSQPNKDVEVVSPLNESWLRFHLKPVFVQLVRKCCRNSSKPDNPEWMPIPASNPRSINCDEPYHLLIREDVSMRYEQKSLNTCMFFSAASALHHLGEEELGRVLVDNGLRLQNVPQVLQFQALKSILVGRKTLYYSCKVWDHRGNKRKRLNVFDKEQENNLNFVVLQNYEGEIGHAVTVHNQLIFDSSYRCALMLCHQSLKWCMTSSSGFVQVYLGLSMKLRK